MKTLTWTTEEEAKVLVGKRVRMTEKHLRGLHWSQAMEWTDVYTITDAYNKKAVIEIPNYGSHCVASGDLLLAEPEALLLDKIAVRVENRAEVEAFIAWGEARNIPMWPGDKETFRTMTEGHCFPAGVRGGYLCAWNTKIPTGLTILSLATFLRDYPAPKPEVKPGPVKAETVPLKVVEPPPWTCPHCKRDYPGRVRKIRFDVHGRETTSCTPCFVALLEGAGWIKPPRRQTRLEAIMEMGKRSYTSEIIHKGHPRGGDR